ncbi:putative periplasmic or exported protein [Heterostelium album PN500]|uniref:Putative periplasmic or exported protein n=1 Tax=Heterostelium pallidum (strain ATCC 26659 / Pp 5 / PN500) TaxID=670386 RepID=D3BRB9_HETP5|nr:putative periplasmic or exported protein [Heterostelium album PN500]EFA75951.1 putative periplasmic or exported protein [Heterostelium album PN500]|eukprot:XP_020428085.1 putative periplasmic or exported protein [Heterostelium album PN500]
MTHLGFSFIYLSISILYIINVSIVHSQDPSVVVAGQTSAICYYTRTLNDDPILFPNQPGMSMFHDFFGNFAANGRTTIDSIYKYPENNCNIYVDGSSYWAPTLKQHGQVIKPFDQKTYYQVWNTSVHPVHPMPKGLQLIAGNPLSTIPSPNILNFFCKGSGYSTKKIDWCPAAYDDETGKTHVRFNIGGILFPDCWDGINIRPNFTYKNAVYSDSYGQCPQNYPFRIPRLNINIGYVMLDANLTDVVLSLNPIHNANGTLTWPWANVYSAHADFYNGWPEMSMKYMTEECFNKAVDCDHNIPRTYSVSTDNYAAVTLPNNSTIKVTNSLWLDLNTTSIPFFRIPLPKDAADSYWQEALMYYWGQDNNITSQHTMVYGYLISADVYNSKTPSCPTTGPNIPMWIGVNNLTYMTMDMTTLANKSLADGVTDIYLCIRPGTPGHSYSFQSGRGPWYPILKFKNPDAPPGVDQTTTTFTSTVVTSNPTSGVTTGASTGSTANPTSESTTVVDKIVTTKHGINIGLKKTKFLFLIFLKKFYKNKGIKTNKLLFIFFYRKIFSPYNFEIMNNNLFKLIINNSYIRKIIFNNVSLIHSIFEEPALKWSELIKSEYHLAYYGYIDTLKTLKIEKKNKKFNNRLAREKLHPIQVLDYVHTLPNVAAKQGNQQLLEYLLEAGEFFNGEELSLAVKNNHYHLISFLLEKFGQNQNLDSALCEYAEQGHFELFKQIYKYCTDDNEWSEIIDVAFRHRQLEIGEWLYRERGLACKPETATELLSFGDRDLIDWMINNKFKFSKDVLNEVIKMGDVQLFGRLYSQNLYYLNNDRAIKTAIQHNQMEMLNHLIFTRRLKYNSSNLAGIGAHGNLEMMKRIGGSKLQFFGKSAFSAAAENNLVDIIDHMHDIDLRISCKISSLKTIVERGNLDMLKHLHLTQPTTFRTELITKAAEFDHIDILEYLILELDIVPTTDGIEAAAAKGNIKSIEFIYNNTSVKPNVKALEKAITNNHYSVVKWIGINEPNLLQRFLTFSISKQFDIRIFKILRNGGSTFVCHDHIVNALKYGRFDIVELLMDIGSFLSDELMLSSIKKPVFTRHDIPFKSIRYFFTKYGEINNTDNIILQNFSTTDLEHAHFIFERLDDRQWSRFLLPLMKTSLGFTRYLLEYRQKPILPNFCYLNNDMVMIRNIMESTNE